MLCVNHASVLISCAEPSSQPGAILRVEIKMVALNKETAAVYLLDDDTSILKPRAGFSIPLVGRWKPSPIRSHF